MSRARLLVVACFTVFLLGTVVSATAFGGQWDVNGTPLGLHATVGLSNILVLNEGKLTFKSGGEALELVCKGHEVLLNGGVLIGPDGVLASSVVFHECKVTSASGSCKLKSSLITTVPVHGLAHLDGTTNALILILPETKTVFTTIGWEGETCALPETTAITGGVHILIHEATTPLLLHRGLVFSLKAGLFVGSSEAELTGLVGDIHLTNDLLWNFL